MAEARGIPLKYIVPKGPCIQAIDMALQFPRLPQGITLQELKPLLENMRIIEQRMQVLRKIIANDRVKAEPAVKDEY